MSLDIAALPNLATEDDGTVVHLRDINGEWLYFGDDKDKKPVTITVAGSYSDRFQRANESVRKRRQRQRVIEIDSAEFALGQRETVARSIIAWDGLTNGGAPFPFTTDNALALLTAAPWIREQLEIAMFDHQRFFSKS